MTMIKIVTDSTADMSFEEFEKYNITMVPLSITIDGQSYLDKIEMEQLEFLEKMRNSKELPKSSQPAVGTFVKVYDDLGSDGSEIISIHMSGGLSGTVRSAESAACMTNSKVTVIDSKFTSIALSFQVLEAAKLAQQGKSVIEIVERLNTIRNNTRLMIVIQNLENLIKGGRIGKMSGYIGSLLNIKPIALLHDGVLHPVAKMRSQSQILKYIIKQFWQDLDGNKLNGIGIAHANNLELSEKVYKSMIEMTELCSVKIEDTTPVISTHAGEGALAVMYYWN